LGRHQEKSGCIRSYVEQEKTTSIQSTGADVAQMTEIFEQLNLNLSNVVKDRYVDDIEDIEKRLGIS
jgi:hypothetical protein